MDIQTVYSKPRARLSGPTFAERLASTGGRPTGFDYLRITLAIIIVAWHTVETSYGFNYQAAVWGSFWRPFIRLPLPMFFSLSGFLVAGSLIRTPEITKFLGLRALRIYPALIAETFLSAFILGPTLTKLPLHLYFTGRQFYSYLLNCAGIIHYNLPGVFTQNPYPNKVNAQLWTVPVELECYIMIALLAFFGIIKRRYVLLWSCIAMQIMILAASLYQNRGAIPMQDAPLDSGGLVMVAIAGVALYALREKIVFNFWLFLAATAVTLVAMCMPWGDDLVAFPVAYMTIYLGLQNPRANALHGLGDLSYGIFLYGYPLEQMVASWGRWAHHWYISFAVALPLSMLVALISWRLIEKPALSLRRHLGLLRPIDNVLDAVKATGRRSKARLMTSTGDPRGAG